MNHHYKINSHLKINLFRQSKMSKKTVDLNIFEKGCASNNRILNLIQLDRNLKTQVTEKTKTLRERAVNVNVTMHDLVAVGKILQIADLGSDSFKSNTAVKG